jgi:hypothetical protein
MVRNLRTLMLAVMAVTALSATWAATAGAHTPAQFTAPGAGAGTTTIKSSVDGTPKNGHHVFDVVLPKNVLPITCDTSGLHGSQAGESATSVTMTAHYTGCTFLGQTATVSMNGCDYTFGANGTATIDCTGGNEITFTAANCTVHVPGGQVLAGITYTNLHSATPGQDKITASALVKNIHGVATGAGCPETGTFTGGEYTTGNTILSGERASAPADITWDATVN